MRALALFRTAFGGTPSVIVRAPGRVNLIGEHTDYNEGFVLPVAIDRDLCIAVRPRDDGRVVARSEGVGRIDLSATDFRRRRRGWGRYVQGVAWSLTEAGHDVRGWDGAVASDVPVGAGLSSSAALELATAAAFAAVTGFGWEPERVARLCQRAENGWVGVASGIMDQLACALGRRGHAILLDCRSLRATPEPVPARAVIAVLDTGTRRDLASSAYNDRRRECDEAARSLGVRSLRDVSVAESERAARGLRGVLHRRVRHVVSENARTLRAAEAMRRDDVAALGALMDESHRSLRDDFEVSSPALDAMVEAARSVDGCYGARLTGAGFGGCAVALVDGSGVPAFRRVVTGRYTRATGIDPTVYVCAASDGASVLVPGAEAS